MKLPYRLGDIFALPLGDGTSIEAQIVGTAHHTVDIAVASLPTLRVTDRALVLERWRPNGRLPARVEALPNNVYWRGAAFAERSIATQLGRGAFMQQPLAINARTYVAAVPTARNDDEIRALPAHARAIRLAGRRTPITAALLARFAQLERLDCSGVDIDRPERLAELPKLRALRIARTPRLNLRSLRDVRATTLAFETIADLQHIDALLERTGLTQLEMLDLWPCELDDVRPLAQHPSLLRAEIDIGGRRKNVELYRRATWAYPWPFDLDPA
jgi:hypothetical protein